MSATSSFPHLPISARPSPPWVPSAALPATSASPRVRPPPDRPEAALAGPRPSAGPPRLAILPVPPADLLRKAQPPESLRASAPWADPRRHRDLRPPLARQPRPPVVSLPRPLPPAPAA